MYLLLVPAGLLLILVYSLFKKENKKIVKNKHVVVTGGSSGIGKAIAILAAQQGAHVTIIARNIDRLNEALQEIKTYAVNEAQMFTCISVDVSNYDDVENNLGEIEQTVGPIYMLLNCAGYAVCGRLEDYSVSEIRSLIQVNLLGSIYTVKAILPKFKERKEGIIVLTASQVALMGMYGYSVYSSCKFALRGLAESVHMEIVPYDISITLALPADTDTPGFKNENKTKPAETKILSQTGGLFKPEDVAKKIMDDALAGKFFSYIGFESFMLTTLCVGMSPFTSCIHLIGESLVLGLFRIISAFYLTSFHNIIKKCYQQKQANGGI